MLNQVLFVHPQAEVCRAALAALAQAGFSADAAEWLPVDAVRAPKSSYRIDLLIADPQVTPGIDWLLGRFKGATQLNTRIMLITNRQFQAEANGWLERGVEDFVVEPLDYGELVVRSKALLARPPVAVAHCVSFGPIQFDKITHRVQVDGRYVELAPAEYRLMAFLLENQGRVFTRQQLLEHAWRNAHAGHRTVDVHVRRLRQTLEPFGCDNLIETVRGFGYRLAGKPRGNVSNSGTVELA